MTYQEKYIKQLVHDIKSPLASLKLAVESIEAQMQSGVQLKESLALLKMSSDRLDNMAEDLLGRLVSKSKKPEKVNVNIVVDNVVKEFSHSLGHHKVQFVTKYHDDNLNVWGVSSRLSQVACNIIKNAIEAMNGQGNIFITTKKEGDNLSLIIKDDGPGIAKENVAKLFNDDFTLGKTNGHGIGLSIVKEVVKEFKGTVQVYSKLGVGTVFCVLLPLFQDSLEVVKENVSQTNTHDEFYVLIDDDERIRQAWKVLAKVKKKQINCFASPYDFYSVMNEYPKEANIYIDENLG